jgi:hypothetical protein
MFIGYCNISVILRNISMMWVDLDVYELMFIGYCNTSVILINILLK